MKRILLFILLLSCLISNATTKDSLYYSFPDSIRAISFFADITVGAINTKKEVNVGIGNGIVKIILESDKKEKEIDFEFPGGSAIMSTGAGVKKEKDELTWKYEWSVNENYRLMIATAGDSAGNFALYSGYIFLPKEKKWKLIGTCKITGHWNTLKQLVLFRTPDKGVAIQVSETWAQRSNGSWKNLSQTTSLPPVVNLFSHIDSLEQLQIEKAIIDKGQAGALQEREGVYCSILKEGTGRQIAVTDTVTIFYKGSLMDGLVFDETKDKPATFPLNRLIRGWQIGVPLIKVGGKIRIIIPSNLAYSIRTRAAKIPPNSPLVFDIEVVDAKPAQ